MWKRAPLDFFFLAGVWRRRHCGARRHCARPGRPSPPTSLRVVAPLAPPDAMLRRAATSLCRRAAPVAASGRFASTIAEGWAAAAPNLDQPNVATDFAKPAKEAEGTGIPSKLTLNFYLPHAIEFDAAEVRRAGRGFGGRRRPWRRVRQTCRCALLGLRKKLCCPQQCARASAPDREGGGRRAECPASTHPGPSDPARVLPRMPVRSKWGAGRRARRRRARAERQGALQQG